MAASVATEDTLKFTEFHSMGAAYAVYLKAVNTASGQSKEGWVSCGSFMFPYKALRLSEQTSLVMPEREPDGLSLLLRFIRRREMWWKTLSR